jgi:outer membrane lipoprotein SlyB
MNLGELQMLKKYFTSIVMATVVGVMIPLAGATSADAQTRYYNSRTRTYTTVRTGTTTRYKRPNVYRRHRKAFNIGIGTGVGMLVGGLLGGRKGVVIGGLAGAGGGALFTHKQRPKNYVRRVTTYRY